MQGVTQMSRPIPRRSLPHTITLSKLSGVDAWNKPTYSAGELITFVRYENVKKNLLNSQGENKDDKGVLFVDFLNSSPRLAYSKGDKITFRDNEYTIRQVDELFGDSEEVHHYEIYLT